VKRENKNEVHRQWSWYTSIYTSAIYSGNELFYVETMIDDWLSFESRLW